MRTKKAFQLQQQCTYELCFFLFLWREREKITHTTIRVLILLIYNQQLDIANEVENGRRRRRRRRRRRHFFYIYSIVVILEI